MPVTARLSKRFYDRLGEDVVNELVEWLNQVDATYKAEIRELNELNFARVDAKLELRIAELRSDLRGELRAGFSGISKELANVRADLLKWSFVFWVGAVAAIAMLAGVLGR